MLRTLIFLIIWNTIIASIISATESTKIFLGVKIIPKQKNVRALVIYLPNAGIALIAASVYGFNLWTAFFVSLWGQIWFGIVFDTWLNFRRFGWSWKTLLYTSNDDDDLNDALLDRLCNWLAPYPYSGLIQIGIKAGAVVGTLYLINESSEW